MNYYSQEMTKAEYILNMYYCHIKCAPEKEKCKNCYTFEVLKQIYSDEEYTERIIMI